MPRPVELRGVSDQTLEALEAQAAADPARDALIARRLSQVPPEFIAGIQQNGLRVKIGAALPPGFTHPTLRPTTTRGRIRAWKQRGFGTIAAALRSTADLFDPDR